jgi:pteridine reductase
MSNVAIVTGAGRPRVGNVVARELARRGFAVVLHHLRSTNDAAETVREIEAAGGRAVAIVADLSNESAVACLVDEVVRRFGRIDLLVNSAAVWIRTPLEQVTAGDVRQHFEVNTLGTFLCAKHVGLVMTRQPEGGSIVNIGDWAIERPYRDYAAYFTSKGAIPTLTRSLAVELASRNPRVRVNAILPGPVMLPADMPPAERDAVVQATLVKREGTPEHVAHAVIFLAENDFVTGVCLPVDGGRTICGGDV